MSDRTIDEVILIGIKAIEQEHMDSYNSLHDRMQSDFDKYVGISSAFFDYISQKNELDDFLSWAREKIKCEEDIKILSDYIRDIREGML